MVSQGLFPQHHLGWLCSTAEGHSSMAWPVLHPQPRFWLFLGPGSPAPAPSRLLAIGSP